MKITHSRECEARSVRRVRSRRPLPDVMIAGRLFLKSETQHYNAQAFDPHRTIVDDRFVHVGGSGSFHQ